MIGDIDIAIQEDHTIGFETEPRILSYSDAVQIRTYAESGSDPYYYEMAAIAFDSLDMPLSAQRCRDRARHYQEAQS
jgi:hypothetical protein